MNSGTTDEPSLVVTRILCEVSFEEAGRVSRNWGPTLRGGFGFALRQVSCSLGRESCKNCPLGSTCAYGYLFETPITGSPEIMRNYTHAPHPFVLEPPPEAPSAVDEGTTAGFSVVLIGKGGSYLPYILLALQRLGELGLGRDKVPFQLRSLREEDAHFLYEAGPDAQLKEPSGRHLSLGAGGSESGVFSVRFETPARIRREGEPTDDPSMFDIVAALRRRVFLIHHFHGRDDGPVPKEMFLEAARAARRVGSSLCWEDRYRYSSRQDRKIPVGGLLGEITCQGDIGVLRPLLRAGEYLHVGKNTSSGAGKLRLIEGATP